MSKPVQTFLPLGMHEVPPLRDLPYEEVSRCRDYRMAIRVGIKYSDVVDTEDELANRLEMHKGTLNVILNKGGKRKRYFDPDRIGELEIILGNRCVSQFFEMQSKGLLKSQKPELTTEEKAELWDREQMRREG